MNRKRLQKLIELVAPLAKNDPVRMKVENLLQSADPELKAYAEKIFTQHDEVVRRLQNPTHPPADMTAGLMAIATPPTAKLKPPRRLTAPWLVLSTAAVIILLGILAALLIVRHNQWQRRESAAAELARLQHGPLNPSSPLALKTARAGLALLKLPFHAIIPRYRGFELTGISVTTVSNDKGLVTRWRSKMGRPCILVQLPQKLAKHLAIGRPRVIHVRDSTGIVTATVTIWRDSTAQCTWAQILPGDVMFYKPILTVGGRRI